MAKTLTASPVEAREQSVRRRTRLSGTASLVIKNLLFWGSIGLSCYALYRIAAHLIG
jgi:hypothetical protein